MSTRILIVDDEEPLVYYLRQTLQLELPASEIDTAYSGEEALSKLAGGNYDLILADMRMPGFDGLALIRGVRYVDPRVPIILMTGFGNPALQQEINLDLQLGTQAGVKGTPAVYINGKQLKDRNIQGFQQAINEELQK